MPEDTAAGSAVGGRALDVIEADPGIQDVARDPKRQDVDAGLDDIHTELTTVAHRYKGPLSKAEITEALFDFADSYAEAMDVDLRVQAGEAPDGRLLAIVRFPGTSLAGAPVGRWKPDDLPDDARIDWVALDTGGGD